MEGDFLARRSFQRPHRRHSARAGMHGAIAVTIAFILAESGILAFWAPASRAAAVEDRQHIHARVYRSQPGPLHSMVYGASPAVGAEAVGSLGLAGLGALGALGLGVVVAGYCGGRRRRRGASLRRVATSGTMAEVGSKLQEYLDEAVEAEALGEEAAAIAKAEEKAKEVVLFGKNGFKSFGSAVQAEKKAYTPEEIKEEKLDATRLLTTEDSVDGVREQILRFTLLTGGSLALFFPAIRVQVLLIELAFFVAVFVDFLASQGILQSLVLDFLARLVNPEYEERVVEHEAARFLIGYLTGTLPKAYTLTPLDAVTRFQSVIIRSGCVFCSSQVQREIEAGSMSSKTVDQLVCTKFAGVAQEYIKYGRAKSGSCNIRQVEDLFSQLNFPQEKSSALTAWALVNVNGLLRRYQPVQRELVVVMGRGGTVAECISVIEQYAPDCVDAKVPQAEEV